jgi:glycosyltransferase involved in cell wall biosynthesis
MLEQRSVIVVVPAFQEENHVGDVVATMPSFVDAIVVVDDGSSDQTAERASIDPRVRLVRHPARRGVGAALTTGYRTALSSLDLISSSVCDEDAVAVMAGDGQMHPDDLTGVVLPIVRGRADYVKGDRFGQTAVRRKMGLPRWFGGQVFSLLTSLAIGQRVSDSQCGFSAISRRALQALDLEGLWPSFGYPNDLLGQLAAASARIREVPVRPIYGTEISKLRLHHVPPIFYLIARAAMRRAQRSSPSSPPFGPQPVIRSVDTRERGCAPAKPYHSDVPFG